MSNTLSIDKSKLLEQAVRLLNSSRQTNQKTNRFVRLLSDNFYPTRCFLIPRVSPRLKNIFPPIQVKYGSEDAETIPDTSEIITITRSLATYSEGLTVGLTKEIENEELLRKLQSLNISSFLIISLVVNTQPIGYFALYEETVPRLWSKEDSDLLLLLGQIYTSFLHGEILQEVNSAQETVLQKAIESSNDGYWHIDLVNNHMHFSRQWKRMLGFNVDELEDSFETFENLIHPDDKDVVLQVLDPYFKIGVGSYECEYRIKNKSGKYIWVLTRAHVNYSDNGVPQQFVATNTDITTRIDYKNKIAQSEAKYEKLVGSIDEIIFEIDRNGNFIFLNKAWEKHLLLKVEKSLGTFCLNYIHPDHRSIGESILNSHYTGNSASHKTAELKFIAANGKSVWMEAHNTIKFDRNQNIIGISGTLVNIDDKKKIQLEQISNENKIARISDNISDIICEIDEKGNYIFISNGVRNMLGRNPESFKNKNSFFDVHPEDRRLVKTNLFDQLLNGAQWVVEQYRVKTGDNSYRWIETVVQPLISVSGQRTFIAASRDISARRKIQEEIQASLQKEKDLNELKSRFITMTSHEFRTPLSSIKSSVELLEMYAEDLGDRFMKPFHRHFDKITSQVSRINNLLNNIDTLGKIEALEMPFNPVNQNILEFITPIVNEQIVKEFENRTVDLKIKGNPRTVIFDPALFDLMLLNVLKNALLYSENGPPKLLLEFASENIIITIKDKGLGIPKDEMPLLFTSFFRANNIVNLNIPGNGLGLVIAKKIMDLHHGTITIDSEENVGTEVTITLPNIELD